MKKQKGFIVPVLVGIIAILLIGAGAYIYSNKKVSTQVTEQNNVSTTTDETTNWKTYTDTQYGVEFKYPNGMVFTSDNSDHHDQFNTKLTAYSFHNTNGLGVELIINVPNISWDKILGIAKTSWESETQGKFEEISIEGIPAVVYSNIITIHGDQGGKVSNTAQTVLNSLRNSYLYNFTCVQTDSTSLDQCNKIISTFKFTASTSTDETTNWKTYSNQKVRLSFKYPSDWKIVKEEVKDNPPFFSYPYIYLKVTPNLETGASFIISEYGELDDSKNNILAWRETKNDSSQIVYNKFIGYDKQRIMIILTATSVEDEKILDKIFSGFKIEDYFNAAG